MATSICPGATTHTQWGAVSAAYKVVADFMEKELIGTTGAELEKTGVRSMPPILVQKPLIETYRPTPWASHSRPLRLLASR
eukprot:4103385-Heterocapsa_arctica.AAC.1